MLNKKHVDTTERLLLYSDNRVQTSEQEKQDAQTQRPHPDVCFDFIFLPPIVQMFVMDFFLFLSL